MTSIADVICDQERTNWLKAWLALDITKSGLHDFVSEEMQQVKARIFKTAHTNLNIPVTEVCTSCCIANLLTCPTQGICKRRLKECTNIHNNPSKQPRRCPINICDEIRDAIIKGHRYSRPSWANTLAELWACNEWQIAKCFLPPDGYTAVSSVEDTDFNGVISVMMNCKTFDQKLSFGITQPLPNSPCLLAKARDIGKDVRHTSNCKVKDDNLQDIFTTLSALLNDPKCLAHNKSAQEAEQKLKQLENDGLMMTAMEMRQLVITAQHALTAAEKITEENTNALRVMQACVDKCKAEFNVQKETCMKEINEQARKLINSSNEWISTADNYIQDVHDFRRRLVKHYNDTLSHIVVSPLMPSLDRPIRKLYSTPIILRIEKHSGRGKYKKTGPIQTYREVLFTGGELNKTVFIQGEAGMGKSTFAAKMVLDWCDDSLSNQPTSKKTAFGDVKTLLEFAFVFHIRLRDGIAQREVMDMIKTQIVDVMYSKGECDKAYRILQQIMKKEACLVIQDGLDEWADCKCRLVLPLMVLCHNYCTVLTTTRQWKMADERIKDSKINSLFELDGVKDELGFSRKILGCFMGDNLNIQHENFREFVSRNNLQDLLRTPMLHSLIVCSWIDGIHLTGSKCKIYSILLDSLFRKASDIAGYFNPTPVNCFKDTNYLKPNADSLEALSKAGFNLLFCSEKEKSLVFSDKDLLECITPEQKYFALKAGVLSERKSTQLTSRSSTCSFIHKSVQEFLAAYHCASNENVIDSVLRTYITESDNHYLDISRVFQFLCGLHIASANTLSAIINEHSNTIDLSVMQQKEVQRMVLNGYDEAQSNNQNERDICLKLSYFDFKTLNDKHDALKNVLLMNKANVRALSLNQSALRCLAFRDFEKMLHLSAACIQHLYIDVTDNILRSESTPQMSDISDSTYINFTSTSYRMDLSHCHNLKEINIDGSLNLFPNALQHLTKLKCARLKCECDGLDLSSCQNLEELYVGGNVKLSQDGLFGLDNLTMLTLRCACDKLDLSSCHSLEEIILEGAVTLLPNALNDLFKLKRVTLWCNSDGLDLSSCQNLEEIVILKCVTLSSNVILELLKLKRVTIQGGGCDELDLSLCANLEEVAIDGEVTLLPNALNGLRKLKSVSLRCCCDDLDLSLCDNLENIELKGTVTLLPNTFSNIRTMTHFTLTHDRQQPVDIVRWLPVHRADMAEGLFIPLPPSLKHMVLNGLHFSPFWVHCLFTTMSTSDNQLQCTFEMCCITNNQESEKNSTDTPMSNLDYTSMTIRCNMSTVSLTCDRDSPELYEALRHTSIQSLTINCAKHSDLLSETLPTINGLKTVRINCQTFVAIELPTSVAYVFFIFSSLSPSSLRNLMNNLALLNLSVKCKLMFNMTEPLDKYVLVKTELDALEYMSVERFNILKNKVDSLERSYTDGDSEIDVDEEDGEFCCFEEIEEIEDEDNDESDTESEECHASGTDAGDNENCDVDVCGDNISSHHFLLMYLHINSQHGVHSPLSDSKSKAL